MTENVDISRVTGGSLLQHRTDFAEKQLWPNTPGWCDAVVFNLFLTWVGWVGWGQSSGWISPCEPALGPAPPPEEHLSPPVPGSPDWALYMWRQCAIWTAWLPKGPEIWLLLPLHCWQFFRPLGNPEGQMAWLLGLDLVHRLGLEHLWWKKKSS